MSQTDKVMLWCISLSICIFFLYGTILNLKYPNIFKELYLTDITRYIKEYNDKKRLEYKNDKRYLKLIFFNLVDLLLSPYLFIIKLLEFFAYIIFYIISWIIGRR